MLAILIGAAPIVFFGCGKEPAAQQPAGPAAKETASTAQADGSQTEAAIIQTTCPIMEGNPINKALFVEYKGKKVYFCCKGCPEKFLADPEKYIAKLPQFKN
jgi:YHS domain-containing protein